MGAQATHMIACTALAVLVAAAGTVSVNSSFELRLRDEACSCDLPFPRALDPEHDFSCPAPSAFLGWGQCRSPEEWVGKSIYQVVTDRFASIEGKSCGDTATSGSRYCGGTWRAMREKLPYVKGMGFDALWISPVPHNVEGAYHGYAATDLYKVDGHFGTAADLRDLVAAAHDLGMWVMIDIVVNHMADGDASDYRNFYPFNQGYHYHDCSNCSSGCSIDFTTGTCGYKNMYTVEHCRLAGLWDLDQNNDWVPGQLVKWTKCLIQSFNFDGIRIDTVPHVAKDFWPMFQSSTPCFLLGEVLYGDTCFVRQFQDTAAHGLLSYPLYFTIQDVFVRGESMKLLGARLEEYAEYGVKSSLWGTFIDNHDNPRFLNALQGSPWKEALLRAALTFALFTRGIPIVYYGTEQLYDGGRDPANREPLWYSGYDQSATVYRFLTTLNTARKLACVWEFPQQEIVAEDDIYIFSRGPVVVAVTNKPWKRSEARTLMLPGRPEGHVLCDALDGNGRGASSCITVGDDETAVLTLRDGASSAVFIPQAEYQGTMTPGSY